MDSILTDKIKEKLQVKVMDVKEIIEKNNLKTREDINTFMRDFVG